MCSLYCFTQKDDHTYSVLIQASYSIQDQTRADVNIGGVKLVSPTSAFLLITLPVTATHHAREPSVRCIFFVVTAIGQTFLKHTARPLPDNTSHILHPIGAGS